MAAAGDKADAVGYGKIKANKYSRSIIENNEEANHELKLNKVQADTHYKDMTLVTV